MTNSFDLSSDNQQENIREFMRVHGPEGFFTLYFRQLFYRFVRQELKSAAGDIDDVGRQLYFSPEDDTLLEEYRTELLTQCEERARELVADMKEEPEFREVIEDGDLEQLAELDEEFKLAVHLQFSEWEEQGIELLEEIENASNGNFEE